MPTSLHRFFILSLSILLFAACSHNPIKNEKFQPDDLIWTPGTIQGSTTRDIALVRYAFERAYVGFEFLDSSLKNKFYNSLDELSASSANLNAEELCTKLSQILVEVPDSHLSVQLKDRNCTSEVWKRRDPSVDENYNIGEHNRTHLPWAISELEVSESKVPVISFFNFPPIASPLWKNFDTRFESLLSAPALIIDLRGNGGGDSDKAYEIVRKLIGPKFQTAQEWKQTQITPEAKALELNLTRLEIEPLRKKSKRVPKYLLDEENKNKADFELSKKTSRKIDSETSYFKEENKNTTSFKNPIVVLMDAATGSTGELMVLSLKYAPNVTTIGENTVGSLTFGNAGLLVLPYSQIQVRISSVYKKFRKSGLIEGAGIKPDIKTTRGQDAIDSAGEFLADQVE